MKKIKYLMLLLVMLFIIPFSVFAEGEETEEATNTEDKQVKVYFFRGEGCSHCAETEEWFSSIEEEYGDRFEIVDYETWNNEDNYNLMQEVAKARNEEVTGVPYIIVGNKSWTGFVEDYKQEILDQINSVYSEDVNSRYDIIELLKTGESDKSSDAAALIIILLIAGGIGFGIYKARKSAK